MEKSTYREMGNSDTSGAYDVDSRKNTSGSLVLVSGSPVTYRSWRLRSVAQQPRKTNRIVLSPFPL